MRKATGPEYLKLTKYREKMVAAMVVRLMFSCSHLEQKSTAGCVCSSSRGVYVGYRLDWILIRYLLLKILACRDRTMTLVTLVDAAGDRLRPAVCGLTDATKLLVDAST